MIFLKVSGKLISRYEDEINYFIFLFRINNKYSSGVEMSSLYFDERSKSDLRIVFTKAVGQEIYRIRRSRVMTGKELGSKLNVSQQQVSRYERGVCNITVDTLILILGVLNVSLNEFFQKVYLNISDLQEQVDESYQRIFLSLKESDEMMFSFN